MKKIISLLLVLVMSLGMLSGLCFAVDMPEECDESEAAVMVSLEGSEKKYYFPDLTAEVINWTCGELDGKRVITLLKDVAIIGADEGTQATHHFQIPGAVASWAGNSRGQLTFDLNGKTLTYTGSGNLFFTTRFGFSLKNGTIIHNSTKTTRGVINIGLSKGATATTTGAIIWAPPIVIEDMNLICTMRDAGGRGNSIITNYCHGAAITIRNSLLWSAGAPAISLGKSTQADVKEPKVPYAGPFEASLELERVTIGSGKTYPISVSEPEYQISAKSSVFVTNEDSGEMKNPEQEYKIRTDDPMITKVNDWGKILDTGDTITGVAHVYGNVAVERMMRFTDVQENDWFYEFVKELYLDGVVAGTSATTFAPNNNLTYGAALKLLVVGLTKNDPGNATGEHWATKYLNTAKASGWTDIDESKLDSPITREAFCEIAAKAKNLTEQPAENKFTDTENTAVLALVKAGVINGMNETTFAPEGILTRAQISKIISLLLKL